MNNKTDSPTTDSIVSDSEMDSEVVSSLIDEVTLDIHTEEGETSLPLHDVMTDVMSGHYELDAYRRGALTYCDALDEEIDAAKNRGEDKLVELLTEVREVTYSLYERIEKQEQQEDQD